jgi:hypothetical protein
MEQKPYASETNAQLRQLCNKSQGPSLSEQEYDISEAPDGAAWSIFGDRLLASTLIREMFEYDSWTIPDSTSPMIMSVTRQKHNIDMAAYAYRRKRGVQVQCSCTDMGLHSR